MQTFRFSILLLFLSGCVDFAPQSSAGLYGPRPVQQEIRGSKAQAMESQIVDFTRDQVLAAAETAIQKLDYQIDESSKKKGMIAASKHYSCQSSYRLATTLAAYVTAIDTFPTTRFTIVVDWQDTECHQLTERHQARQLAREIQQLLNPL